MLAAVLFFMVQGVMLPITRREGARIEADAKRRAQRARAGAAASTGRPPSRRADSRQRRRNAARSPRSASGRPHTAPNALSGSHGPDSGASTPRRTERPAPARARLRCRRKDPRPRGSSIGTVRPPTRAQRRPRASGEDREPVAASRHATRPSPRRPPFGAPRGGRPADQRQRPAAQPPARGRGALPTDAAGARQRQRRCSWSGPRLAASDRGRRPPAPRRGALSSGRTARRQHVDGRPEPSRLWSLPRALQSGRLPDTATSVTAIATIPARRSTQAPRTPRPPGSNEVTTSL
jgi:hypothetical protein